MTIENLERMTREERQAERDRLAAAARQILDRSNGTLSDDARVQYDEHLADLTAIRDRNRHEDDQRALIRAAADNPGAQEGLGIERGTPGGDDRNGARGNRLDIFGEARKVVDAATKRSAGLPDDAAEKATRLFEHGGARERDVAARWAIAAGNEHYAAAFTKLLSDPTRGHMLWSAQEQAAYREVEHFRAMSLTGTSGGFMVPLTLDPAILLSSAGSVDPMRRVSRVVQTATNQWSGVTSAGVTAEWIGEGVQVADATPVLANPNIPVHKADAFVPFSFEVGMDAVNFEGEVVKLLVDAAAQLQAAAYMSGTGTGQPTGILTTLAAGQKIATTAADVLAAADVYKPQNQLPSRFQPNATFLANLTTINQIQAFETAAGSKVFPEVQNDKLLRKPLLEASFMKTAGATPAAGNDDVLLYGDFSNYVIVDRIGSTVELIQNLVGAAQRPTGQRGLLLWFRTGGDSVIDGAFRLLQA